jgi:hypothetical protein
MPIYRDRRTGRFTARPSKSTTSITFKIYRDSSGRFTHEDKRKVLFDYIGKLVSAPSQSIYAKIGIKEKVPAKFEARAKEYPTYTFDLVDRKKDEDLYTYLNRKNVNDKVEKFRKMYKGKVILCNVKIYVNGRKFVTKSFKVSHYKAFKFISGKRGKKGLYYKPSDIISHFIHEIVDTSTYTLYRFRTDTQELVMKHGKKANYGKARFTIQFKAAKSRRIIPRTKKRVKQRRYKSNFRQFE